MKAKTFNILTLVVVLALLLGAVGITGLVDPFFHYHKPLEKYMPYQLDEAYYKNPGIAAQFDYDAAIVGSSLTQNFRPSQFQQRTGLYTIKLPAPGANLYELNLLLGEALRTHPNLTEIYWGCDLMFMQYPPDNRWLDFPEYLYDGSPFTDVNYLLDKTVLTRSLTQLESGLAGQRGVTPFDEYDRWDVGDVRFGEAETSNFYRANFSFSDDSYEAMYKANREGIPNITKNLEENILPLVTAYPGTHFSLFFSPYSILYWQQYVLYDSLDALLAQLEQTVETLLSHPNVSLYFFAGNESIITNLYLYKDHAHYNTQINEYMMECMTARSGQDLLTRDNYRDIFAATRRLVQGYDFDFTLQGNPFLHTDTLADCLGACQDDDIVFLLSQWDTAPALPHLALQDLARLGVDTAALNTSQNGYLAAFCNGKTLFEKQSAHPLTISQTIGGLNVSARTTPDEPAAGTLILNDVTYTGKGEGLAVVVYRPSQGRVVCSSVFDLQGGRRIAMV